MYLASKSPQRKALLESLGVDFEIVLPEYEEEAPGHELPAQIVERHSRGKAFSVLYRLPDLTSDRPVLGVDTMIVFGGKVIGKPRDEDEAYDLLSRMSGQTHLVYSGITLVWAGAGPGSREEQTGNSVTEVRFAPASETEVDAYIDTGEWRERAGGYAIQGKASAFIEEIRGDYTNVVGLPVSLLVEMLREKRQWPPASWSNHP